MNKNTGRWFACSALLLGVMACADGGGGGSGTGGSTGTGGVPAGTGGVTATGGARATGGSVGTGGTTSTGGNRATGGSGTGGTLGTGGVIGTGGTGGAGGKAGGPGAGGSGGRATGGAPGTGGAAGAGGTSAGGKPGTGGAAGTGGAPATGGTTGGGMLNCPGAAPSGVTAAWCSCEQFGQWTNGSATFYNDIWGSGAGQQCIWATTSNEFGFVAQHPNSSGIKSYPNISYSPGKAISALGSYTSSFAISVPSGGSWESAYDVWVKNGNTRIEIMLWMYTTGGVQPIASKYTSSGAVPDVSNVTVGGDTWNVFYGSNGSNDVVSLLRTANTTSGTVDIKAILNWIISNKGSFTSSWSLDQVQFGFEITSDPGVQSFTVTSFSVSSS
jgi:hypothetical protein